MRITTRYTTRRGEIQRQVLSTRSSGRQGQSQPKTIYCIFPDQFPIISTTSTRLIVSKALAFFNRSLTNTNSIQQSVEKLPTRAKLKKPILFDIAEDSTIKNKATHKAKRNLVLPRNSYSSRWQSQVNHKQYVCISTCSRLSSVFTSFRDPSQLNSSPQTLLPSCKLKSFHIWDYPRISSLKSATCRSLVTARSNSSLTTLKSYEVMVLSVPKPG